MPGASPTRRGWCPRYPSGAEHRLSSILAQQAQSLPFFPFADWGGQRENILLCFPTPRLRCPKPLPQTVSLLCLALCPQAPGQLFRRLQSSLGTPLFPQEAVSMPGSTLQCSTRPGIPFPPPHRLHTAVPQRWRGKHFLDEPTSTQVATRASRSTSPSTRCSVSRGAGVDEWVLGGCLQPPLQPQVWRTRGEQASTASRSRCLCLPRLLGRRGRCSISLPSPGSCKTSHCDTPRFGGPAGTLASRAAFEPRGCPLRCQPKPKTQRLARGLLTVVHFPSIYNGLRNAFPRFNLTCYKLKSPSVGEEGGAVSSPLANPL